MSPEAINLRKKLELIDDTWSPKVIAQINDYLFKLVKIDGDFVWHKHDNTDEAFFVIDGEVTIEMEEQNVTLKSGEMYVVPKGVLHKPHSRTGCQLMLIEPKGTPNTGDAGGERTADEDQWI